MILLAKVLGWVIAAIIVARALAIYGPPNEAVTLAILVIGSFVCVVLQAESYKNANERRLSEMAAQLRYIEKMLKEQKRG